MSLSRIPGLLSLAFACASSLFAAQTEEWRTYSNENFGYELRYPAGWSAIEARPRTNDGSQRSGDVLLLGELQKVTFEEPEGRTWPGQFVVRVREHTEQQSLDEWADSQFLDVHDASLVTGSEDTTLAGRAARRFKVFGFDRTKIVVAFVHGGTIFEVDYTGSTPNDPDLAEHGSIYEHMERSIRLVPSIEAEAFDLGGPCIDGASGADFHTNAREAARNGDHRRMIELHKQYVRAMCANHHRWHALAEAYLGADLPEMAIRVLHELHRRGAEIKPAAFRHQESLVKLMDTPEFQRSELGRELRSLQAVADRREEVHRKQLDQLDAAARPPQRYVAEGACPFECCSYREWKVLETTRLYDVPFSSVVVASVAEGREVRGVTGDVHLQPVPVAVVHDRAPFVRGEIIFVLDYLGEGFSRYWRNGEIAEAELWIDNACLRPSRDCWAEYILSPEERRDPEWWILIETDDGTRGWTDRPEHFGNKDACG